MPVTSTNQKIVDVLMTAAQEFASAWSLVGTKFDVGCSLASAEEARLSLRHAIEAALEPIQSPMSAPTQTGEALMSPRLQRALPVLAAGQAWCCSNGCGECETRLDQFEYSRLEYPNGDVESKWKPVFVSNCCGMDLMLWDAGKQDFSKWNYVVG